MGNQLYTWEWVGGGYNSCTAGSKEEALSKAMEMGAPARGGMTVRLVPDLSTFRAVTHAQMIEIDRSWAAYCD